MSLLSAENFWLIHATIFLKTKDYYTPTSLL